MTLKDQAREIDALQKPCGWTVQDKAGVNLYTQSGIVVREVSSTPEPAA